MTEETTMTTNHPSYSDTVGGRMTTTRRFLITSIPQVDGGTRLVYARTARDAAKARRIIAENPPMIDHLGALVSEVEDVARPLASRR